MMPVSVPPVSVISTMDFGALAISASADATSPLGTAYAVWTGIGVAGVALPGERMTPMRLAAIGMIVAGVAMLKLADG